MSCVIFLIFLLAAPGKRKGKSHKPAQPQPQLFQDTSSPQPNMPPTQGYPMTYGPNQGEIYCCCVLYNANQGLSTNFYFKGFLNSCKIHCIFVIIWRPNCLKLFKLL